MTIILLFGGTDTTITDRNNRRGTGRSSSAAPQLFAARYNNYGDELKEVIYQPSNLGVRWALPGGMQRMELTVRANSRDDARNRYNEGLGERWALLDAWLDRPICDGWCYEIVPDGRHVHYIISGSWKRHEGRKVTSDPAATTTNTNIYWSSIMTSVGDAFIKLNTNYMEDTGTDVGNYQVTLETTPPTMKKVMGDLLAMGNSSNEVLDYWLVPNSMNGVYPQLPLPYLVGRDNTATASWQVKARDLSALDMSRNIWDMVNYFDVLYTQITTVSSGGTDGSTSIVVADASELVVGDEIQIQTDGDSFHTNVIAALAGTTVTLTDPLPDAAAAGNLVKRVELVVTSTANNAESEANYWINIGRHEKPELNATQAAQYRDAYLAQYANPAQLASFTIGSGMVRDGVGNRMPVWRMLINPGIIRINDLFADGAVLANTIDGRQSFRIVALDYDHNQRSMRVTPDTLNEARLDVLLQRAGMTGVGQMIDRA